MVRDTIRQTPDLFSARGFAAPSTSPSEAEPGRPSRRTALPKNLPKAIQFLEDRELDWLLRIAIQGVGVVWHYSNGADTDIP
jgi:hypothetical protein